MPVEDLRAWGDIQDMIADGDIDEESLDTALDEVGAVPNGSLSYQQFAEVIEILQNEMEGVSVDDGDEADDEEDDEDNVVDDDEEISSSTDSDTIDSVEFLPNGKGFGGEKDGDIRLDDISDDEFVETIKELYNDLKGKATELTVAVFMDWEDLNEMKEVRTIIIDTTTFFPIKI